MAKYIFLGFLLVMALLGCEGDAASESAIETDNAMYSSASEVGEVSEMSMNRAGNASGVEESKKAETVERKLIKEGDIEFETEDISKTRSKIIRAVETFDAYISSDKEFKTYEKNSNTIVIRVPAENFDKLLSDATEGVEQFDKKNIQVRDVTEEFVDVQARLKTEKELEKRYIKLLDKAKDIPEILEVEKKIGETRADIESMEGRLKYLQDRVSYSTLTLAFYKTIPNPEKGPSTGDRFGDGFSQGWDNLVSFFIGLTYFWPFILIGIAILLIVKISRRKRS